MSFRKKFFKDAAVVGGYNYATQVISFFSTAVMSRLLLPSEYGIVALIVVFTGFVSLFTDAGLSYDIIRSEYKETYLKAMGNLSLLMGIILFTTMLLLAYPISLFYDNPLLFWPVIVMSFTFIVATIKIVPYAILSKRLEFAFIGKMSFFTSIFSIALMIVLAFLNFSFWSLILPPLVSAIILYFIYAKKANFPLRIYPMAYTIAGFRKSKHIMVNLTGFSMINYWARQADNLIVGKVYGEAALGIYNRAYRLLLLSLSLITGLFGKIMYPSLQKLKAEGGPVQQEYINLLGLISLLNWPIAFVLLIFPHTFVRILWGQNWLEVAEYLPYFGLLVLSQTLISTTGNFYILYRKEKTLFYIGVVSASLIITSIILGSLYSVLHIARFYTLCYLALIVPINLIFGFSKTFGFEFWYVIKFWGPKLILSLVILFAIWVELDAVTLFAILLYLVHIIIFQRKDLASLFRTVTQKINSIRKK